MMADRCANLLLQTASKFLELEPSAEDTSAIKSFLKDPKSLLVATTNGSNIVFETKIDRLNGPSLVYYKTREEPITESNFHDLIMVTSLSASPLKTLYQSIQSVFTTAIQRVDENISVEAKLKKLLFDLEEGMEPGGRSSQSKIGTDENDFSGVISPLDEAAFWQNLAQSAKSKDTKARAEYFNNCCFDIIRPNFQTFKDVTFADFQDGLEITQDALDDLWTQQEVDPSYPEARMKHLLECIGNSCIDFTQYQLQNLNLTKEECLKSRDDVKLAIAMCEHWTKATTLLTGHLWKRNPINGWKGATVPCEQLQAFVHRLQDIIMLITFRRHLMTFLGESAQSDISDVFSVFGSVNPLNMSKAACDMWDNNLKRFNDNAQPIIRKVLPILKKALQQSKAGGKELLRKFTIYKEVIQFPAVKSELSSERENLLSHLLSDLSSQRSDFMKRSASLDIPPGRHMSKIASSIVWTRQQESRIEDALHSASLLLSDLKAWDQYKEACSSFLDELKAFRQEKYDEWSTDIISAIEDARHPLGLQSTDNLMVLDQKKGTLDVRYSGQLVSLLREVRQLNGLGYAIPAKILETANTAQKFYRHANILKRVAHFYNTVDQQMIPSQQAMLLDSALAFEKLIKSKQGSDGHAFSVQDIEGLESYITQLQSAVEAISFQNRKLRKYHEMMGDKTLELMNFGLLKYHQRWKDRLNEMRVIISDVERQGFSAANMKPWIIHWNRQIYKSLEHQYQMGIYSLQESMPTITIDMTFRQQKIQFRPSLEEVRAKYYRELKKFLSIPIGFRGLYETVPDNSVFHIMIKRNAKHYRWLYQKAESILSKAEKTKDKFKDFFALAQVDIEKLIEENFSTAEDWESCFRQLKTKGREAEQLPGYEQSKRSFKFDCIVIQTAPAKSAIDDMLNTLFDTLVITLRRHASQNAQQLAHFLSDGMATLNQRAQTLEEVTQAYSKHNELQKAKAEQKDKIKTMAELNRLLASVAGGGLESLDNIKQDFDQFELMMDSFDLMMKEQKDILKQNLAGRIETFHQEVEKFAARWNQFKPSSDVLDADREKVEKAIEFIKEKRQEFDELAEQRAKIESECEQFDVPKPEFTTMNELKTDLESVEGNWILYEEFNQDLRVLSQEEWIIFRSKLYLFEELLVKWDKKLKENAASQMSVRLQKDLNTFKDVAPVLKHCRGENLQEDHWFDFFRLIGVPKGTTLQGLTFDDLLKQSETIIEKATEIKDLNARAQGEVAIREAIRELELWGAQSSFTLVDYKDSSGKSVNLIKDWKDIVNQVGENQSILATLKSSPFFSMFADKINIWEVRLSDLDEFLHALNQIQRKWVYLEPIFGNGALPQEQSRFQRIDQDFRSIIADINRDNRVVSITSRSGLKGTLSNLLDQLQRCQRALNSFLEEKRSAFPRFYFLGDEDLLEILGQSTNPTVIQSHLRKLFAGINTVQFDEKCKHILSMVSSDGETVQLKRPVRVVTDVEKWLNDLAVEMKSSLKELLFECLQASDSQNLDPGLYPSQVLSLCEQIRFTKQCEEAIEKRQLEEFLTSQKRVLEEYTNTEAKTKLLDIKLKDLILDAIHNISVVEFLMDRKIESTNAWEWQKQLRFYANNGDAKGVSVGMVNSDINYTFEYQGNAAKLVHTPLTDKCFLTLTQALSMGLGGSPFGPAGTGKTESVKALGCLCGRQVLVFNCDEGIDVKSMGRIFTGIVKCGAWGCFDEFNRLDSTVLSALSMQIQEIQAALVEHRKTFQLLGKEVDLDPHSGIFITMNPAGKGYGGRQKLPDNLKQLFRPVAMTLPDIKLITETLLFAEGFKHAKSVGSKLVSVFSLAKQLLTKQQHYDWGLRALKPVLRNAGLMLKSAKNGEGFTGSLEEEAELITQVIRLNTLSKLTFSDELRFDALVQDVFFGVKQQPFVAGQLEKNIEQATQSLGLLPSQNQMKKVVELNEQMNQRMGIVIVGPCGSGKTTLWQLLKASLELEGQKIKVYTLNPKSISKTQLLGKIDTDTREWTDGIITNTARIATRENQDVRSWIVCDGDVDPEWIEALNSVLDDNRLLTMPSGERIQFGSNINYVFETDSLTHASPATVSRMGMVLLSDEDVDIKNIVERWIEREPESIRENLKEWTNELFYKSLEFVLQQNQYVVDVTLHGVIQNGLSLLHGADSHLKFIAALARGFGGNLPPGLRDKYITTLFEWAGTSLPNPDKPWNIKYDERSGMLITFSDEAITLDIEALGLGNLPLIKTAQSQSCMEFVKGWLAKDNRQPFFIVGPDGCGKNSLLRGCVEETPGTDVVVLHCTAQTTPEHLLRKLNQHCIQTSSSTGRVYRPKETENLVVCLKDVNLAKADKWGTCQLHAFLQQIISFGGFYDASLEWMGMENIQIVATLNPLATRGGNKLPLRLTSVVRICSVGYPDESELETMGMALLPSAVNHCFGDQPSKMKSSESIHKTMKTMVSIHEETRKVLQEEPYTHYVFTPRDLIGWIKSILRYEQEISDKNFTAILGYEARRIYADKLVNEDHKNRFEQICNGVFHREWGVDPEKSSKSAHEYCELDLIMFEEVFAQVAAYDRVLTNPKGSLLLPGLPGVGRKTALSLVAYAHQMTLIKPKLTLHYGLKEFQNEVKQVMQLAGIDDQQVLFLVEEYQLVLPQFLEIINALLASGDVPGLYNNEELDSMLSNLRSQASDEGFRGSLTAYFSDRVRKNLHVAIILDSTNPELPAKLQMNPALYKECTAFWMDQWSKPSLLKIPRLLLPKLFDIDRLKIEDKSLLKAGDDEQLANFFSAVYADVPSSLAFPQNFLFMLKSYASLYADKVEKVSSKHNHLKGGVDKIDEAKSLVAKLKAEADKKSKLLAEKQGEANKALKDITSSLGAAGDQKEEMEQLKVDAEKETIEIEKQKKLIEKQLAEVEPMIQEAKAAVGNIKSESLGEIRSLRAPPPAIRDILEGVLLLMGVLDSSWSSMRSFLGKSGVKEEIMNFDARQVTPESRKNVAKLLKEKANSFDPQIAKRASTAAAPLASWVKANVEYATILEKIAPLENQRLKLEKNMKKTEKNMSKLSKGLKSVDEKVSTLQTKFEDLTGEATEIKIGLEKEKDIIKTAETLISRLDGEHKRWKVQMAEQTAELKELHYHALLSAAFLVFLPGLIEEERARFMESWKKLVGLESGFEVTKFLSAESEQLLWKTQGLPGDSIALENAIAIQKSLRWPVILDPSHRIIDWIKTHYAELKPEVVSAADKDVITKVELGVRFGKFLVIRDVDKIEPTLFSVCRKDLMTSGSRSVVQIGEKSVDYNENFKLLMFSRSSEFNLTTEAAAALTKVNFATTRTGLASQLLAVTIGFEKPELEKRREELVKQEEEMRLQLVNLEEKLLKELASSKGNILENKELMESLNKAKESSETIAKSLKESVELQDSLDKERMVYQPLADTGSGLYFVMAELHKLNPIYKYSLGSFLLLFERIFATNSKSDDSSVRVQMLTSSLHNLAFFTVGRSLFEKDRAAYGLYYVHGLYSKKIPEKEWEFLMNVSSHQGAVSEGRTTAVASWIDRERHNDVNNLRATLPQLYQALQLENANLWSEFARSRSCENSIPSEIEKKTTHFQHLLLIQAVRPDRLHSAMQSFTRKMIGLNDLAIPLDALKIAKDESSALHPILFLVSPGSDPSDIIEDVAKRSVGLDKFHRVAMGQGQRDAAMEKLLSAAESGHWLYLQNVHLDTEWLQKLKANLTNLTANPDFRLWMSSEAIDSLPDDILRSSLKLAYEAPPGLKQNLRRTYADWTESVVSSGSPIRAQSLFALAWFNAFCQERRKYIPQGWSKFYDFGSADLRAATAIIQIFIAKASSPCWDFVRGLLQEAIYASRIDNDFDARIVETYLEMLFDPRLITGDNKARLLVPDEIRLPGSEKFQEYMAIVSNLPDEDLPSQLGLPANIQASWQRTVSGAVLRDLRHLSSSDEHAVKNDIEAYSSTMSPLLTTWKQLNQNKKFHSMQLNTPKAMEGESPMLAFLRMEFHYAVTIIQSVHRDLADISKGLKEGQLGFLQKSPVPKQLLVKETPDSWQNCWEGPTDPQAYISGLVGRASTIQQWIQLCENDHLSREVLDIAQLFHPQTFLKALQQQSARHLKQEMDAFSLSIGWKEGEIASNVPTFKLTGFFLEGALFDGTALRECTHDSPTVSPLPTAYAGWLPRDQGTGGQQSNMVTLPIYLNDLREEVIATVDVPCGQEKRQWVISGTAIFLRPNA